MKVIFAVVLATIVLGNVVQVVEMEKEEDRRELLAITGPIILAACISGAVGGIVGAVSTAGINACAGEREKTIVIVRDQGGNYREEDQRRNLMGDKDTGNKQNSEGVFFMGAYTCPTDGFHIVVAVERDSEGIVALPEKYFDEKAFEKLPQWDQEAFNKITPRSRWQGAIQQVIAQNRAKKQAVVQPINAKQAINAKQSINAKKVTPGSGIAVKSVASALAGQSSVLPFVTFGVASLLLGGLTYRKCTAQNKYVYEELLDQPI